MNIKTLNEKEKTLVAELKAVMEKHGVSLDASDEYDGEENYAGTTYEMVSRTGPPNINLSLRELTGLLL